MIPWFGPDKLKTWSFVEILFFTGKGYFLNIFFENYYSLYNNAVGAKHSWNWTLPNDLAKACDILSNGGWRKNLFKTIFLRLILRHVTPLIWHLIWHRECLDQMKGSCGEEQCLENIIKKGYFTKIIVLNS